MEEVWEDNYLYLVGLCPFCDTRVVGISGDIVYCEHCHVYFMIAAVKFTLIPLGYGDGDMIVEV